MARARTVDGGETATITVRLPVDMLAQIEGEALAMKIGKTEYVRLLIIRGLNIG